MMELEFDLRDESSEPPPPHAWPQTTVHSVADALKLLVGIAAERGADPQAVFVVCEYEDGETHSFGLAADRFDTKCRIAVEAASRIADLKKIGVSSTYYRHRLVETRTYFTSLPCSKCFSSCVLEPFDSIFSLSNPGPGFTSHDAEVVGDLVVSAQKRAREVAFEKENRDFEVPRHPQATLWWGLEVDEGIVDLLRLFNSRGFTTQFSCQGNPGAREGAYIFFPRAADVVSIVDVFLELAEYSGRDDIVGWLRGGTGRGDEDGVSHWTVGLAFNPQWGTTFYQWSIAIRFPASWVSSLNDAARSINER